MSMWLSFVRVSPEAFAKIEKKPDLLEFVFFSEDKKAKKVLEELGIEEDHSAGLDYMMLAEAFEAMSDGDEEDEDEGAEDDAVLKDLGTDGKLDYDAGYGEAFYLKPSSVKRALEESNVPEGDDEVKKLFKAAAKAGHYVIGSIS